MALQESRRGVASQALEQRFVEPLAHVVGQRNRLRVTVYLNRFSGSIHNEPAIAAAAQVRFDIRDHRSIELTVQVTAKLVNDIPAVQAFCPRSK